MKTAGQIGDELHRARSMASGFYSKSKGKSLKCLRKDGGLISFTSVKISLAAVWDIGPRASGGPERLLQPSEQEVKVAQTRVLSSGRIQENEGSIKCGSPCRFARLIEFSQNPSWRKGLLRPAFRGGNGDLERRGLPARAAMSLRAPPRLDPGPHAEGPCPLPGPPLHLVVLQHRKKWNVWLLWKPVGPGQPGRLPQPREWRSSLGLSAGGQRREVRLLMKG